MKENNLYKNITQVLVNCLKNDYLKSKIIVDLDFRKRFVEQLGILLGLEKQFDCKYSDDHKYVMDFAQGLANMTDQVETIEKADGLDFNALDEKYIDFIEYAAKVAGVEKSIIKDDSVTVTPELIEKLTNFDKMDANEIIKNHDSNLETPMQGGGQGDSGQPFIAGAGVAGAAGASAGAAQNNGSPFVGNNPFNQNNMQNMQNMLGQNGNLPVHPRIDPRFYPYTSKPRWMLNFKRILAFLVIIGFGLSGLLMIAATAAPLNMGGGWWRIGENGSIFPWFGSNFPFESTFQMSGMKDPVSITSQQLSISLLGGSATGYVFGIIIILIGAFIGYQTITPPRLSRDRYVLRMGTVIIDIIVAAFVIYDLCNTGLITGIRQMLISQHYVGIPNLQEYTSIPGIENNINLMLDRMTNMVEKSQAYKVLHTLDLICVIILGIMILASLFGYFGGPRFDREKIMRANMEYQKAMEAAFRGERYEMDPSLYDDEFEKDKDKKTAQGIFNQLRNRNKNNNKKDRKDDDDGGDDTGHGGDRN